MSAPEPIAAAPRDTYSEAWRHECEVRLVASWTPEHRDEYCEGVQKRRGRSAAVKLWRDAKARTAS